MQKRKRLVILRTLDYPDLGRRFLTDFEGNTPVVKLDSQIYQVLAVCPFGTCEESAYEFLASEAPPKLHLAVRTHSNTLDTHLPACHEVSSSSGNLCRVQSLAQSKTIHFSAVDPQGEPFPGVLLIVRDLRDGAEVGRYLTNLQGESPPLLLKLSKYRVIATCPHGTCATSSLDVCLPNESSTVQLALGIQPTDPFGEIIPAAHMNLSFIASKDKKDQAVRIFARDKASKWFRNYLGSTDETVKVALIDDPTFLTIIFDQRIIRKIIAKDCKEWSWASVNREQCIAEPHSGDVNSASRQPLRERPRVWRSP